MELRDKNILLFSTAFFGYENKIIDKLNSLGAVTDYYNERSVTSALGRALIKISPKIFASRTYRYYKNIVDNNSGKKYNYIFWNGVTMLDEHVVKMIKQNFPDAVLIMYLPDSIKGKPWIEKLFVHFDKVITFDRKDYVYYKNDKKADNIYFRPLYYADCYCTETAIAESKAESKSYLYDICFIGTIHSDRYRIIKEIRQWAEQKDIRFYSYCYLQSKFIYYFYKFTKKEFRNTKISDFEFKKLDSSLIVDIVDKSKAVLDVQYPLNSGLTMRTIEMLGLNKKLITSNQDIMKYDFYNENNICVIDRSNVHIPIEFIEKSYIGIPYDIYSKYSMQSWLEDIFETDTDKMGMFFRD